MKSLLTVTWQSYDSTADLPDWVHQVCTLAFAEAVFLRLREKKQEEGR